MRHEEVYAGRRLVIDTGPPLSVTVDGVAIDLFQGQENNPQIAQLKPFLSVSIAAAMVRRLIDQRAV